MIDTAVRHLESKRYLDALKVLLEGWEHHRSPGLAVAIDQLGDFLDRSVRPIPTKRRQAAWMDRFADRQPADLAALMACAFLGTSKEMKSRVDAMLELPPDPRTTRAMLAWADMLESTSFGPWGKVWTALFKVTNHVGDPRMRDGLLALQKRATELDEDVEYKVHAKLVERIHKALKKFPAPGEEPPGLERLLAVLDPIAAGKPPGPQAVYGISDSPTEEILPLIYENPDDDGPIMVWADMLAQEGGDLGTWVGLHLAAESRPLKKSELALERKISKANKNRLLGPVAGVVDTSTAVFRRGLLEAAHVNFKTKALETELKLHPAWRTLTAVQTKLPHLRSGALPNVRRFGIRLVPSPLGGNTAPPGWLYQTAKPPTWATFIKLANSTKVLPLQAVCASLPEGPADLPETLRGLPRLEELHLCPSTRRRWQRELRHLGDVVKAPWFAQIRRLVLDDFLLPTSERLPTVWEQCRKPGDTLFILSPNQFNFAVTQPGDRLHVVASISKAPSDFAIRDVLWFLGPPARYGRIEIRSSSWEGAVLDRAADTLAPAGELVLPKRKRGT